MKKIKTLFRYIINSLAELSVEAKPFIACNGFGSSYYCITHSNNEGSTIELINY